MQRARSVITHLGGAARVQIRPHIPYSAPGVYYPTLFATARHSILWR